MIRRPGITAEPIPSSLFAAGRILAGATLGFAPAEIVRLRAGLLVPRGPIPIAALERRLGAEDPAPDALQQLRLLLLLDFVGGVAANHYGVARKVTLTTSSARLLLAAIRRRPDVVEEFNSTLDDVFAAAHRVVEADGFDEVLNVEKQIARGCFPELRFAVADDVRSAVASYVGAPVLRH